MLENKRGKAVINTFQGINKDKRYNEAAEYAEMVLEEYDERMAQYAEAKKQDEEFHDDNDDLNFIDQAES